MAGDRPRQIAVGLAVAAALGVYAQEEPPPTPTFRSETNYVQLPVRVLDANGQFVSGLTQADFRILEDGRPQTIAAFSAVDIPSVAPDSTVPSAPLAVGDAVATNEVRQVDGRVYLFVLDDYHTDTDDTHRVRNLMHGFIRERLSGNDLAAITIVGGGRAQNFTRNRQLLHDAVDRFIGDRIHDAGSLGNIGGLETETVDALSSLRQRQTINAITRMVEWLGSIKGRRKSLVWISSRSCSLSDSDCRDNLQHALRVTMQSDVSIHVIDPAGLAGDRRSAAENANPNSRYGINGYSEVANETRNAFSAAQLAARGPWDGARYLAEESGGVAILNTNDFDRGLDRIVQEASAYYLLAYHSTNSRADGKFRRNEVTVARKDLRVVYRNGYFAARQPRAGESAAPEAGTTVPAALRELARSPLPISAMPLRVAAAPFLSGDGMARVAVVVEVPHEGLRPATDADRYRLNIGLSIGFYDRDGRPVGNEDPTIDLNIPLNAAPKVTGNGVRLVTRITVPPGAYRFWVGAVQMASGLRGSVMTEIDIPDFDRHPLALSGIAISSTDARRVLTARTDGLLDDVLGGPPVAHREFSRDSELWLYGEIYDHRSAGGDVTADVVVRSDAGREVYRTEFEPAPIQFGHLARVPLETIGPGAFVATVEARSSSPQPVSATRTVAFQVR